MLVRKIRQRLASIYKALGDEEQFNFHTRLSGNAESALGLVCGVCDTAFGTKSEELDVLTCTHILHSR